MTLIFLYTRKNKNHIATLSYLCVPKKVNKYYFSYDISK